eukprot:NODE_11039_length_471_cov_23.316860_g11016_i0.p1 GENE.NODE_11039_length_471_cov_23.316860_g11016_i0~~NODE_11039_length_471_cov_23.316860_g11016_i0.p1  ORF type:complete len:133 (-),score=34.91 NODE_11039_length_471_cov_23.316860_g11016_i0:71-430(-)
MATLTISHERHGPVRYDMKYISPQTHQELIHLDPTTLQNANPEGLAQVFARVDAGEHAETVLHDLRLNMTQGTRTSPGQGFPRALPEEESLVADALTSFERQRHVLQQYQALDLSPPMA